VAGPGQSDCLLLLVNGLFSEGYKVLSSSYDSQDGMVEFAVRVVGEGGAQLSAVQVADVRELIERLVSTTSMSVRPAIYGMVAERELERLARWGGWVWVGTGVGGACRAALGGGAGGAGGDPAEAWRCGRGGGGGAAAAGGAA
jgi:hypothetical protein